MAEAAEDDVDDSPWHCVWCGRCSFGELTPTLKGMVAEGYQVMCLDCIRARAAEALVVQPPVVQGDLFGSDPVVDKKGRVKRKPATVVPLPKDRDPPDNV